MKLRHICINNLRRRKGKAGFLFIGLLIGVATIVSMLTITRSLEEDIKHKMDEFGANIIIIPRADQLTLSYGGISLGAVAFDLQEIRQADIEKIYTIPNSRNISRVAPKVMGAVDIRGQKALMVGVDFQQELTMKQWWNLRGVSPQDGSDLLAGNQAARALSLDVGQRVELLGRSFQVSGVLAEMGSQDDSILFVSLPVAQQLLGKEGKVNLVEVSALCKDCPVEEMVQQISRVMPETRVMAIQQVVKGRMQAIDQLRKLSMGISLVVIIIGSLMVMVTMMGAVNERINEIGIFRAIGFREAHILRIILLEAGLVSLAAGVVGFLVGMGTAYVSIPLLGGAEAHHVSIHWNPVIALGSFVLPPVFGLLASLYPALRASRMDPVTALRAL